ncbi:MAG: SagB/ThcOx family dehydrogenase [Candidatus Aminicenantes bacterium]|nr:SagB/ThcOx family dehydrogenase [Candidatus Aminicenantes bacterium]
MYDLSSIFLIQSDANDSIWEMYHANTKLSPCHMPPAMKRDDPAVELNDALRKIHIEEIEAAVGTGGKRYATTEKISLPATWPNGFDQPLKTVLEMRSSQREFSPDVLSHDQLSAICRIACGLKLKSADQEDIVMSSRFIPSAGALYPLELYLLSFSPLSGGGASGAPTAEVWHYEPQTHCLERILRCDPGRIRGCFQTWPELPPPIVALITGVPKRQSWKYGPRAYRYTVMESGHAVQNIVLGAAAMDIHACPVVGFYDDALHDLLDIDGVNEVALYTVFVGQRVQCHSNIKNEENESNE